MKSPAPRNDIAQKLAIQRRALQSSADAYDKGELWEAERLATAIHILVHDQSGRAPTASLLGQAGMKPAMRFLSSSRGLYGEHLDRTVRSGRTSMMMPPLPLLIIQMNDAGTAYIPACQAHLGQPWMRNLAFSKWWDEKVYASSAGPQLSRKSLVFNMRNKDGGAHVDPTITDAAYAQMRADAAPQFRVGLLPLTDAHYATVRQIAWEVETSIESAITGRDARIPA